MSGMHEDERLDQTRRRWLRSALCASACVVAGLREASATGTQEPTKRPPQPGDELAFPSWEHDGRLVHPDDLPSGAPPLLVYPRDPASGIVRERSRINQILLLRPGADDAVIAFSGICTHAACAVSEWNAERRHFVCPCHASEYDPLQRAKVVSGPAPRALPALPVERRDDRYVIAGPFSAAIGATA